MNKDKLREEYIKFIGFSEEYFGITDIQLRLIISLNNYHGSCDELTEDIENRNNGLFTALDFNKFIWDSIEDIETTLSEKYPKIINNVYAGEYPDNTSNAHALKFPDGFLVLINSGLLYKFYIAMVIICRSLSLDKNIFKGVEETEQLPGITQEQAVVFLLKLITDETFTNKDIYNEKSGFRIMIVNGQLEACIRFILAHEYGHVHYHYYSNEKQELLSNWTRYLKITKGVNENLAKLWCQELYADGFALEYLMHRAFRMQKNLDWSHIFDINAPIVAFALESLFAHVKYGIKFDDYMLSHPTPALRGEMIRNSGIVDKVFVLGDYLAKHIKYLENLILSIKN